jgi:truncated hemoglobin YjbI
MNTTAIPQAHNDTVFVRLGGEGRLAAMLDSLYAEVMEDDHLREYFFDVDLARQKAALLAFLRVAFGDASTVYRGPSLNIAHAGQLVTELAFDAFVDRFVQAAAEKGIDADTQMAARAILKSMRASVITEFRPNPAYNYPTHSS